MVNMSVENKFCWQLDVLSKPTSCFKKAGNLPCSNPDCLVINRMLELMGDGFKVDKWWEVFLIHTRCRMSSLSDDNFEYKERLKGNNGD